MQFVGAIIEHPEFGFLLQQRDAKAPSFPLHWTVFGGAVELGESALDAIKRELSEEINLRPEHIIQIRQIQKNLQPNDNTQIIFHLLVNCSLKYLTLREGKQMKFVKHTALFNRKFAFNIKEVFQHFLTDTNN